MLNSGLICKYIIEVCLIKNSVCAGIIPPQSGVMFL